MHTHIDVHKKKNLNIQYIFIIFIPLPQLFPDLPHFFTFQEVFKNKNKFYKVVTWHMVNFELLRKDFFLKCFAL